jgi:hypothetical protein
VRASSRARASPLPRVACLGYLAILVLDRPLISRGVTVVLAGSSQAQPPGERLEFTDLRAAWAFLAPIAADSFQLPELQRLAADLTDAPLHDVHDITGRLALALVDRRIAALRFKPTAQSGDGGKRADAKDGAGDGSDSAAELEWIEARLLDEDGVGIANQKCVVVAPDAQRHEAYTDSLGTTRINAIPRGACKILYPELDVAALPKSETARPTKAEMRERFTAGDLIAGQTRPTAEVHEFRLLNLTLKVRLNINPNDTHSRDDQFILHAVKGSAAQKIIKTIKDDKVPGDDTVDLVYEHLWREHRYTLEVDPGAEGEPYNVFKDIPLQQLVSH